MILDNEGQRELIIQLIRTTKMQGTLEQVDKLTAMLRRLLKDTMTATIMIAPVVPEPPKEA